MVQLKYLPIEKERLPYKFSITIQNKIIKFLVRYNSIGGYFTADILDKDDNIIAYAKKFLINVDLLENVYDDNLPKIKIIPYDPSDENKVITFDNFMEAVKPYIFEVVE